MITLTLASASLQVLRDLDYPSRPGAPLSANMGVPSYERPSSPSVFTPTNMSPSRPPTTSQKKPKLSLQTSCLPITFGKSSTALAIAASALPAASPTVLNTFNNAYDMPHRFSPATASPTGARSARTHPRLVSPFASSKDDRPYQVPLGLRSILRHSPMPFSLRRTSICPASESPRTSRRAFFPAAKKVAFRVVLEEEIKTSTYTARHSDLSSDEDDSDTDERSEPSLSSSDESNAEDLPEEIPGVEAMQRPRKKRKAGSDRQIEAAALRDCIGNVERIPKQPKSSETRRKRRRRHWVWTLGPFEEPSSPTQNKLPLPSLHPSSSQMMLPLSAPPAGGKGLPSPPTSSSPFSAAPAPSEDKLTSLLPSPSHITLPPSATVPSRASSATSVGGTEEENTNISAESACKKE